jgi:hypothetical protein
LCAGSHVITRTWTATDGCGNSSNCVQTITVTDTKAPTITCPGNVSANGGGQCCVAVAIGQATATDDCSAVTVTSDAPAQFCVGDTTVTWTAADGCGNSSTCRQTVTVLGQICATKFYDANANGVQDGGEIGVEGWLIQVTGTANFEGTTDANGQVCFNVPVGAYAVSEATPLESNWVHTTGTTSNVTIDAARCSASATFGNYCFSDPSGGLTLGYWSNKNGQRILQQNDPAWRTLLSGLNLRNANGTGYDVPALGTFTNAYASFRTWILGATATNMSYMLSAQLAAATLASQFAGLDSSAHVIVPGGVRTGGNVCVVPYLSVTQPISCGAPALLSLTSVPGSTTCGCTSNNGQVRISDLLARADCLLGSYGTMGTGTPQRTYGECVKNIIDMINNNGNNGYACGGISQVINSGSGSCPATFR